MEPIPGTSGLESDVDAIVDTGVKPGVTLDESDELGFIATVDRVHVRDLHATVLHLLGLDHERPTFKF